ncbi:MAG TPA: PqiC family protein [Thermodesulfovibrionales bacterium]|jgi:uncharacterized lipoprotein YmbA|nr:PqiC family protein [Thermodesulfovibrionales bacterium]
MRTMLSCRLSSSILGAFLIVLTGCASSPPSRFYQLNPVNPQTVAKQDSPSQGNVIVAVGPIRIPDYLDRPQIVTRSGQNELKLSEFDRWAGSLENDIILALVDGISSQLPGDRFSVMRWSPLLESKVPSSYRIEVQIIRFEGTPGGSVTLRALSGIFGKDRGLLFHREFGISEQVSGSSYDDLIDAMSKALESLSRNIAEEMKAVVQRDDEMRKKG